MIIYLLDKSGQGKEITGIDLYKAHQDIIYGVDKDNDNIKNEGDKV